MALFAEIVALDTLSYLTNLIRKAGVMGVVLQSGEVKPGDFIRVELPLKPFKKLERV